MQTLMPGSQLWQPRSAAALVQKRCRRLGHREKVLTGRRYPEGAVAVTATGAAVGAGAGAAASAASCSSRGGGSSSGALPAAPGSGSSSGSSGGGSSSTNTSRSGSDVCSSAPPSDHAGGAAASPPPPVLAAQRGTQPPADSAAHAQAEGLVPPREQLPCHLAVIMDGNSRWAAARGVPRAEGYRRGVEALRTVVRCCHAWGIPCLTVYAFSSENWRRAPAEVAALLALMERVLAAEVAELASAGVRLRFMGELEQLPASLRRQIQRAELATTDNSRLHLSVALSYSGRADLARAVREIAAMAAAGKLAPEEVTPELIERHLATRQLPPAWRHPDLVVRTSGEQRLSNFLIFESAYSELHFSPTMWPDFGQAQLAEALRDYAQRERRFGGRQVAQQQQLLRGPASGDSSSGSSARGGSGSGSGAS